MRLIFVNSLFPLIKEFIRVSKKFERLYSESNFVVYVIQFKGTSPYILHEQDVFEKFEDYFSPETSRISINYIYQGLNKNDIYDYSSVLRVNFGKETYTFSIKDELTLLEKSYSDILSDNEIKTLIGEVSTEHKKFIEQKFGESNQSTP